MSPHNNLHVHYQSPCHDHGDGHDQMTVALPDFIRHLFFELYEEIV